MEELVLFGLCYVLVFVLYQIFIVSKAKKNYEKEDKKYPVEVKYLMGKYNLDMEKIKYNQLLQMVALVSSFDISFLWFIPNSTTSTSVSRGIDRIVRGYVIDFLDFTIFNYNYPIFNIADTFIVIGILILILLSFKENKGVCYEKR